MSLRLFGPLKQNLLVSRGLKGIIVPALSVLRIGVLWSDLLLDIIQNVGLLTPHTLHGIADGESRPSCGCPLFSTASYAIGCPHVEPLFTLVRFAVTLCFACRTGG
jgi:hypothetical protein